MFDNKSTVTEEDIKIIIDMSSETLDKYFSRQEIANKIGKSKTTVYLYQKKYAVEIKKLMEEKRKNIKND